MEPAKIDWKTIDSIFVEDKLYETINAPTWVDFLNPQDDVFDSDSWFCRPDCNHPKTVEDFLKSSNSKLSGSPLDRWNLRDTKLKWRGQMQSPLSDRSTINGDSENQNPNLSTPPTHQAKYMKSVIKSSAEKKTSVDDVSQNKETLKLKSTLSARNLFAGKDILSHISEFCNELKKMATRAKEREIDEKVDEKVNEKERKPLLEVSREILSEGTEKGSVKEKLRRKKLNDDAENIPIPLNLENVKHKGEERLLQIRTNPPSPQCFSATHSSAKTTPSKSSKSRLMERGILQEVKQNKEMKTLEKENGNRKSFSIVDGRESAKPLDVFWFLKPCTLSS